MKKTIILLIAVFLVWGVSVLSFAKSEHAASTKKTETFRGKIISIDTAKNEITVKSEKTQKEETFTVSAAVISTLKANEKVKVEFKKGSNAAEKITKLAEPAAAAAKVNAPAVTTTDAGK